jgi:ABC-2 type transport system permease protein
MNWFGTYVLLKKEILRFSKVGLQTILAPVITILLYLVVFQSVLSESVTVYKNVNYASFLVPGLMMMSIIQNSFANSSSSLFQAKQNGNILFVLLAPISHLEFFIALVTAAIFRGLLVGTGVWLCTMLFITLPIHNIFIILLFAILGSGVLGTFGLIAGIISDKWDHIGAFQSFVILPLSFLSGVFYSINNLPGIWSSISYYNPFFYMIDGFRYGFLGVSDAPIVLSTVILSSFFIINSIICLMILNSGYRLRN